MRSAFLSLPRWFAELRRSDDLRRKRLLAMLNGVTTSLGNKLLAVLITFVSVPLTIGYLGPERYGAWIAINAFLAWVGLTDLGLSHGLTNAVTSAASRDRPDLVRMHLSNFLFLIGLVSAVAAVAFAVAWPLIDWGKMFGVSDAAVVAEVRLTVAVALALFLIRLPLAIGGRVLVAYQEGHLGNYWAAAGNVLTLLALVLVTQTEGGLPLLAFALTGVVVLVDIASLIWLFGRRRPALRPGLRHVDRRGFGEIVRVGYQFFLISIMALVTFQTDVLVIARFLGSAEVPSYNLTYQLFNYAMLPHALIFPYLWAAYNEAITRGDIAWVRRALRLSLLGGVAWAVVAALGLIVVAKPFIGWWAGPAVVPTTGLVLLMAAWLPLNMATNTIACLLAAASHLRNQLIYSACSTVSNLVLSVLLVTRVGAEGVIGATILSYLVFVLVPSLLDARFLLRRLERERAPDAPGPAAASAVHG